MVLSRGLLPWVCRMLLLLMVAAGRDIIPTCRFGAGLVSLPFYMVCHLPQHCCSGGKPCFGGKVCLLLFLRLLSMCAGFVLLNKQ